MLFIIKFINKKDFNIFMAKYDKYIIITYNISRLEQKKKMQFIRKLQGYDSIKKGKIERKHGILEELHGFKFGTNTMIVPFANKEKIGDFFRKFKINTRSLQVRL